MSEWKSGLKVTEKVSVFVPLVIQDVCDMLAKEMSDEFSLCTNYTIDNGVLKVNPEYYIPEQTVSGSAVDYEEDCSAYSTIIHRHPSGVRSFSGVDKEYINRNHALSLLYIPGDGFITGNFFPSITRGLKIELPIEIESEKPEREMPELVGRNKIKARTYTNNYNGNWRDDYYSDRDWDNYEWDAKLKTWSFKKKKGEEDGVFKFYLTSDAGRLLHMYVPSQKMLFRSERGLYQPITYNNVTLHKAANANRLAVWIGDTLYWARPDSLLLEESKYKEKRKSGVL